VFEVEDKVDYAEIEVFYPAEASNHPPSRKGVRTVQTFFGYCSPGIETEVPNWFYYYSQVYSADDVTYAQTISGERVFGLTCRDLSSGSPRIYLSDLVSPCRGEMQVPLFRRSGTGIVAVQDERLWVRGIHKFVVVVEHERVHARLCEMGVDKLCNPNITDNDMDDLSDGFELLCGLDPNLRETVVGIPDIELIAYLIEYGKLLRSSDLWQYDWANCGLQYGQPQSPFPYAFESNGVRRPTSRYSDLITGVPCL
jgi:hypothetical protein